MNILRQFKKSASLRLVNLAGLSVVFACLLLSTGYLKREWSYDRHHTYANRIVRMTLQFDDEAVDGRIWGNSLDELLRQTPEIERTAKLRTIYTAVLTCKENTLVINDFLSVNREFLEVFDIPLLQGNKNESLQRGNQVLISERLAKQLFGEQYFDGELPTSEIVIGGSMYINTESLFVSGIFKDMPETSHFHSDILLHLPDEDEVFAYTYLLLKEHTDIDALAQKLTDLVAAGEWFPNVKVRVLLMPLTDIHLHSRNLRELDVNGNIYYLYLVLGANLLLLMVALFNLWLNASLIFAHGSRYYQLLRLHGAPSSTVFKDETLLALILGVFSMMAGALVAFSLSLSGKISAPVVGFDARVCGLAFLLLIVVVSLLPAIKNLSATLFLQTGNEVQPLRFSYQNVKYMFTLQYAVVMIVVILAFGMNRQMNLVKERQVGGNDRNILVTTEQPGKVQANNDLLRAELLKHTEIESVTTAFQMPGMAIRDVVRVQREADTDGQRLPIMVAGADFLSFFHIPLLEGRGFSPAKYDYQTEEAMLIAYLSNQEFSEYTEEYILNRKALQALGFSTPQEAVGQLLQIEQGTIDYFNKGVIVGVTDDFNYTGLYEETIPLLIMQRRLFQNCMMVRFAPGRFERARALFEQVWKEVNPDVPANYSFMDDVFTHKYHNEINAQQLVNIFSLLCLLVADLGLIVFMTFIIRRRSREIGIRKIHGSGVGKVMMMLNIDFVRYVAVAFAVAAPIAWYVMRRWLERFAYRTSLDWWVFALAGLTVLLLCFVSVSWQSWRAAAANPVEAVKAV